MAGLSKSLDKPQIKTFISQETTDLYWSNCGINKNTVEWSADNCLRQKYRLSTSVHATVVKDVYKKINFIDLSISTYLKELILSFLMNHMWCIQNICKCVWFDLHVFLRLPTSEAIFVGYVLKPTLWCLEFHTLPTRSNNLAFSLCVYIKT